MKKYLFLGMLVLPLLILASWAGWLAIQRESGREVKVVISGYDPRDLLSGHYLAYTIDWNRTDCRQFNEQGICPKKEFCHEARWGRQCHFYIPDAQAAILDDLFRHHNQEYLFEVVYTYCAGQHPMAKKLLINGQEWDAFLTHSK